MKPIYTIFAFMLFVFSCSSSKNMETPEQITVLETLVNSKQFKIESLWAYPQTTMALQRVLDSGLLPPGSTSGSISLVGNYNFLKVSGDSITSSLPYYGERRMQVGYGGTDSTIEFKGLVENYSTKKIKNNAIAVMFKAKSNNEMFDVYIELSPNLKSDMVVNGMGRNGIRYSGNLLPIEDQKK